jgi:hypothetical protein
MLSTILAFLASPLVMLKGETPKPDIAKPDPCTIDGLIAWLETKNPCESYRYESPQACLFGQYGVAMGWGSPRFSESRPYYMACQKLNGGRPPTGEPFGWVAAGNPHTFGAALKRARAWKSTH